MLLKLLMWCFFIKTFVRTETVTLTKENEVTCVVTDNNVATVVKTKHTSGDDGWKLKTQFAGVVLDARWESFPIVANELKIEKRLKTKYGFSFCGKGIPVIAKPNLESSSTMQSAKVADEACTEWKHYYLKIFDTNITIFHGNRTIFTEEPFLHNNDTVILKSSESPSFWKLHQLFYMNTTNTHSTNIISLKHSYPVNLSIFITVKMEDAMTLNVNNKTIRKNPELVSGKWQKLEFKVEPNTTLSISAAREKNTSVWWAINSIIFYHNAARIYEALHPVKIENNNTYMCQLSVDSNKAPRKPCPVGFLGSQCRLNCSFAIDNEHRYCESHRICQRQNDCFCAWGYRNTTCAQKCDYGSYGLKCDSSCTRWCIGCDHITGFCVGGCKNGYEGEQCDRITPKKGPVTDKTHFISQVPPKAVITRRPITAKRTTVNVPQHRKVQTESDSVEIYEYTNTNTDMKTDGFSDTNYTEGATTDTTVIASPELSKAHLTAVICLLITILITIGTLCYLCWAYKFRIYPFDLRKRKSVLRGSYKFTNISQTDIMQLSDDYKMNKMKTIRSKPELPAKETELEILIEPIKNVDPNSLPIKIDELENYLVEALGDDPYNNNITKQYKKLQTNISKPSTAGSSIQNITKNRYKNLTAYDDTRVILKDNVAGDYINANYIQGYENENAFIATQAPLPSTVVDFWWMIWQENVTSIIMLTELVESGTVKCEQYWPVLRQKIQFGKIIIENTFVKIFSDYVHRQFNVQCDLQTRLIHHFQYTTWPDHGVPFYPQNFTPFVKRLLAMPQQKSPIVVHCNAGCGRTGTLILCDIVLRMAAKEKKVDFVRTLVTLREQRAGLLNNVNQYVFAHFVVEECLFGKDFSIPINDSFQDEIYKVLRKTTIKPVMAHLDKVTDLFNKRQGKFGPSISENDRSKNRFPDILPGNTQMYLPIDSETLSQYINAITVDCYRCPKKFIVTQQPLPNTLKDFWSLIKEFEVNTIVSLNEIGENDSTCPQFWSSSTGSLTTLQTLEQSEDKVYTMMKLKVADKSNKSNEKIVNVLRMKNWKREVPNPPSPKDLITLWKEMFNSSWKGNSQIVVTCYDGSTASGLFVALAYLLEKMNYEQVCDVFSAIRTVRQSRTQFVQEWGQIEFLYKTAQVYVEEFDNYDNFNA